MARINQTFGLLFSLALTALFAAECMAQDILPQKRISRHQSLSTRPMSATNFRTGFCLVIRTSTLPCPPMRENSFDQACRGLHHEYLRVAA